MTIDKPSKQHFPDLRSLWQEAFGDTAAFLDSFFNTAFDTKRCRLVMIEHELSAALYWFDCSYLGEPIAYLYAIATAKKYRGRGVCSALIKDTHRHLEELGYAGAVLVPGSRELFDFYSKNGYQLCSQINELRASASAESTELRKIDANEYALIRRAILPRGGIIQENENLRFLQTQTEFYAGNEFLLAAKKVEGTVYGAELLGDVTKAPFIVKSLGADNGIFRVQGKNIPFAMYRPLGDNKLPPPSYFGLAFD